MTMIEDSIQESTSDGAASPGRRQWTLKGIDDSVVEAARDAARSRGMKLNSWVSLALSAAARDPGIIDGKAIQVGEISSKIESVEGTIRVEFERISEENAEFRALIASVNAALVKMVGSTDRSEPASR